MSMPADEFYARLPKMTKSLYLTGTEARVATIEGTCITLSQRNYAAPIGMTVGEDLRNGAEGVDAIVGNDGGNAYRVSHFEWANLGYATQLQIEFDTLLCKGPKHPDDEATTT